LAGGAAACQPALVGKRDRAPRASAGCLSGIRRGGDTPLFGLAAQAIAGGRQT
jgi:hypothetical protein